MKGNRKGYNPPKIEDVGKVSVVIESGGTVQSEDTQGFS